MNSTNTQIQTTGGIGLALGMGGARGFCHIGVLQELEAIGAPVARVAGCSMGALIGAAWAADRLEALEDWARGLTRTKFLGYLDVRVSGGGFVAGNEIGKLLDKLEIPELIEDLPRPFRAVATDLATGREVWFEHGPVRPAVRASVSIPGVLTPMRYGDMWLVDGALVDPVPVAGCRALGRGPVIAVDPNGYGPGGFWTPPEPHEDLTGTLLSHIRAGGTAVGLGAWFTPPDAPPPVPAPNYMDVIWASVDILTAAVMRARLAASPPDLFLDVPLRSLNVLAFEHAAEAIDAGRQAVRDSEDAILALVP